MSMPSSPKLLTSETADDAKVERPKAVDAGVAKFEEYDHPPIESRTLR
jgi:hypothetical protein